MLCIISADVTGQCCSREERLAIHCPRPPDYRRHLLPRYVLLPLQGYAHLPVVWLRMERLNDFGSLQEMLGKFPKLSAYADRIEALDCVKSANKKLEESYK